jgi:hypothetical protein
MNIETFCKVTFFIHILIAQGGFLFLSFYRFKGWGNTGKRIVVLFVFWVLSNLIFNGCPLTHVENLVTHAIYGVWPMPGYGFDQSWVAQILKVGGGS